MGNVVIGPEVDKVILEPTGSCFDDVVDWIKQELLSGEITLKHFHGKWPKIVHGICLLQDGKPYAHSWLEIDQNIVLEGRIYQGEKCMFEWPRKIFYQRLKVKLAMRYTLKQAYNNEKNHGPGPWENTIRILCKDFKGKSMPTG